MNMTHHMAIVAVALLLTVPMAQGQRPFGHERHGGPNSSPGIHVGRIEILEALYGREDRYADVTRRVQAIVDSGRLEFEVENEILGVDPYRGEEKRLKVTYVSGGKRYREEVKEGRRFRFERGGGWACWDPWFQGSWPGVTFGRVEFHNNFGDRLNIYHVNDFGRWVFVRQLFEGERFSARSPYGQTWLVTDDKNRIIRQIKCGQGEDAVVIRRGAQGPWWGDHGGGTEIRFVNRTDRGIRIHRVTRNGSWDRIAEIGDDGAATVRFSHGESWVATDHRGRLIASGQAGRQDQKIEIRD